MTKYHKDAFLHLNLCNDLCYLIPQHLLPGHDLFDLGVELDDVDDLPGVLRLHIGTDREVIFVLGDLLVGDAAGEMVHICPGDKLVHDAADVLLGQLVVIGNLDALRRSVNKKGAVVRLALFQHNDAGGNGGAVEQVAGQLDNAVNEVVVDQVLADFLDRKSTRLNSSHL